MITAKSDIILHAGQLRMMKYLLNDPVKYNAIVCPRQFGKTTLARELVLFFAFNHYDYARKHLKGRKPKKNYCAIHWFSTTHKNARKTLLQFSKVFKMAGVLRKLNTTDRFIELSNGTVMYFDGVESPDNIRGGNAHYIFLDEFDMYQPDVWNLVLKPFMAVKGYMAFFISTPKGKRLLYDMYMRGVSKSADNNNYKSCKGHYSENPLYDRNEIEDAKRTLPSAYFKQEYEAEFIDGGQSVFGDISDIAILNSWANPIKGNPYYNGCDIGKENDFTVSTTIDNQHRVANILRMNRNSWKNIIDNTIADLKRYDPYSLIEVNGVGSPVFEQIKLEHRKAMPFMTSNENKRIIIENLIADTNNKELILPSIELMPELHDEFNSFTFNYTPKTRQISYGAREGAHDDIIMSLALANLNYRRYNKRRKTTKQQDEIDKIGM